MGEGHEVRLPRPDADIADLGAHGRDDGELTVGLDLAVSLGGDRTMLRTVDLVAGAGVPIIGVNVGQMGYLTDIEPGGTRAAIERFLTGERTIEGFFRINSGIQSAIARGRAYAPYADMIWCETSHPDLGEARQFAEAIHTDVPGKLLAYNSSPSFNWQKKLDPHTIAVFQRELGAMGYRFQFVTLAGFHALNHTMFELARKYKEQGMKAYSELQQAEFASEEQGYTATRHQREVGTGYFDLVSKAISGGQASTTALEGSTEQAQF
jgi:isocitrate lyase